MPPLMPMTNHHHHDEPSPATGLPPRPEYWTTLDQYEGTPAYARQAFEEFPLEGKPERFFEEQEQGEDEGRLTEASRRTFLKLSGFAALFAVVQGCERPEEKILPYVKAPEGIVPGIPTYYASTCTECSTACGLLVKTREGRPTKLEGNPDHPVNRGSLCTRGQASILHLYDPDRLKFPVRVNRKANQELDKELKMAALDQEVGTAIRNAKGQVVLVTPTISGPAHTRLIADFLAQGQNFVHVTYDPLNGGEERRAHAVAFNKEVTPRYRFDKADVVVLLGGDPLAQGVSPVEYHRGWAAKRKPTADGMSRIYSFEPTPTLSGMNADYRYPTRPDHLLPVGLAIAHELILNKKKTPYANDPAVRRLLESWTPESVAAKTRIAQKEIVRIADSLAAAEGRSIIYASSGASQTEDAQALHLLVAFLNSALGNYRQTIDISVSPSKQSVGNAAAILQLVEDMNAGKVSVLMFHGVNPAYTLPKGVGWATAVAKVGKVVSLNLKMDESTALADVAIPGVHGLESWGDAEPQAGLFSVQQPAIQVLFGKNAANDFYDTRAWQESVMAFIGAAGKDTFLRLPPAPAADATEEVKAAAKVAKPLSWYDYVRESWKASVFEKGSFAAKDFEDFWITTVRQGLLDTVGDARRDDVIANAPVFVPASLSKVIANEVKGDLVLVAQSTAHHGDGVSMGNPHLLESPDPVSKNTWDNFASIAPATAARLGLAEGDVVGFNVNGGTVNAPVWIQPGTHPNVVAINTGWGRKTFGGIGEDVGVDVYHLLGVKKGEGIISSGLEAKLGSKSGAIRFANPQGHNYLHSPSYAGIHTNERHGKIEGNVQKDEDTGKPVYDRPIVAETTWNEWKGDPYHAYPNHTPHGEVPETIWHKTHQYKGHFWGMSIDMNACTGCGACVMACNIENNIPVVGRDEIRKGREMFWIRIDRYYRGDKENPDFAQQAMLCQHCSNAPCETVCPVIATMHNEEGLNVMTYNRCVGTRYCANNCPYKVRRFNFWQFSDYRTGPQEAIKRISPMELVLNPEVTTRSRGVMEKCTFCVHRIKEAKGVARDRGTPLEDGDLQTACQQTCPAKAITFGDQNNPNSSLVEAFKDPRGYGLLADLNTAPSVRYQALVRNRDEPSPYRTMYQDHRLEHGGGPGSHGGHGNESHDAKGHGAPATHHEPAGATAGNEHSHSH